VLSHHEFATLVLLNDSSDPTELDYVDVDALLAHRLVTFEHVGPNPSRPRVTTQGYALLQAFGRARASDCRGGQTSQ
jgi:hypothetical protein